MNNVANVAVVDTAKIQGILAAELPEFNTKVVPAVAEGAVHIHVTPPPKKTGPGVLKKSDLEKITSVIINVERTLGFKGRLQRHSPVETFATFTLGAVPV